MATDANAAPAPAAYSAPRVSYVGAWTPDHATLTVTVSSGRFAVTPSGVEVLGSTGAVAAEIPTSYRTVTPLPSLNPSGATVTLRSDRPVARHLQDIDLNSTVAGAAIGCVVGALIGLIFFVLPAFRDAWSARSSAASSVRISDPHASVSPPGNPRPAGWCCATGQVGTTV